jgi:PAS domain S-box-containing protein
VTLEERRDLGELGFREQAIGFVAVGAGPGRPLEADHQRFLATVRHELALAFRTAQLRDTLWRERATLSAILDGVGDAIIAVDGEGRIVRLNEAAGHLLGVDTSSTAGLSCRTFLGCAGELGTFRCGPVCPFGEILGGTPPITNREQTVVSSDGTRIPVAASYARMPGPEAGAVAVLRDLRAAHALDEMRSSFVAAVSHELRTPLALVSGYVQSLLHLPLDARTERQYLERV